MVLLAAAVLSHWLTDDPDRTSTATMFFTMTGSLASMVAALHAVLDRRSRHHSESPSEAYRERLAEAIRGEVGDEIDLLGLAGTDYIEVEWTLNPQFSTDGIKQRYSGTGTVLKEPLPRDVSTLAADWREHSAPLTLILGGKGSGKSTTAMLLTHQLLTDRIEANREGPVPVLFPTPLPLALA